MELWIRSQDKEILLNIKGIQYQNCKLVENETVEANILIGFYNYYDNEILGEYETKERALWQQLIQSGDNKRKIPELVHYVKVTKSDRYSNNNGQIICSPKSPVQIPFQN